MTGLPLVSIVTPTLNQGRFIEATIRSIQAQTYDHFEHIVVDGGSTDETLEVLRRHEGTYPLRWLSEPDAGMYDAINKGMRLASGEILAYLNSDDLYFPWTLETVVEAFARHRGADVVYGDGLGINDQTGLEDLRFQPPFRFEFLLRAGSFVQPAVFWTREIHGAVGEFDQAFRLAGDLDFWLRIGPDRRFVKVDELLAIERDHDDTKRSSQWDQLMSESVAIRNRVDRGSPPRRRLGLIAGRFRAWWARRVDWARFARETRRSRRAPSRPWARFLGASHLRLSYGRLVVTQLPWLGRRIAAGSLHSGVDWLHRSQSSTDGPPSGQLRHLSADWDELGSTDPLWAILSDPTKTNGRWDVDEFLATGRAEVDAVLTRARGLGLPIMPGRALDFGCGVGRVTRALAPHFRECVGVDISSTMIERAVKLNQDVPNTVFRLNRADDLRAFPDGHFDLIYSSLVLQHVPERRLIVGYLAEFARLLSPGGLLVFQLPGSLPLRYRIQPRRRMYHLLRRIGMAPGVLQRRLGLYPISMTAIATDQVVRHLRDSGLTVVDVERSEIRGFAIENRTYWATPEAAHP